MSDFESLRADPNVSAFLRVIRAGESGQGDDAYTIMFGGSHFTSFADHPRQAFKSPWGWTSAAGAYQAMCAVPGKVRTDTWGDFVRSQGPHDFSPESQDKFALWCIRRRGALDDVLAGRIEQAIAKCAKEWASLPGSPYGQPTVSMAQALATYRRYGGQLADEAPQPAAAPSPPPAQERTQYTPAGEAGPQESNMAPFLAAVLPSIVSAVPKLIATFGSGSEISQRNQKAAEVVAGIAKEALGAVNEQEVAERLKTDPQAPAIVKAAVEANWFAIQEAGGGGIDGARKADAAVMTSGGPWYQVLMSPSFWALLLLLPLVYIIVLSLVGVVGSVEWSQDARAGIAGMITGSIVGGAVGYYWGQTTSRNRTKEPA